MSFLRSITVQPNSPSWVSTIELAGKECSVGFVILPVVTKPSTRGNVNFPFQRPESLASLPHFFLRRASLGAWLGNRSSVSCAISFRAAVSGPDLFFVYEAWQQEEEEDGGTEWKADHVSR